MRHLSFPSPPSTREREQDLVLLKAQFSNSTGLRLVLVQRRIELQSRLAIRLAPRGVSLPHERDAAMQIGQSKLGIERDGRAKVGDGGFELVFPQMSQAAIVEGGAEFGIEAQRPVIVGNGAV